MNPEQLEKAHSGAGFIAALDQSGGSTPKALKLYGIPEDAYSGDEQMFDLVHEMRTRIITSPAFDGGPHHGRDPVRDDDGPHRSRAARPPTTCGTSRGSCRS